MAEVPVTDFGPKKLKAVRQVFIEQRLGPQEGE
jgi:hypothetical protein